MTPEDRKAWLQQEESRIIKYQHQHRGLSFIKLFLPPTTDTKVNLVGLDNHIYRGSIPRVAEDQLPPEVDEKSIDEEALYKEIRDMNYPPVLPNEPLGPSRRIGGIYTLAKSLTLAPVHLEQERLEETLIMGKDGGFYKGTEVTEKRQESSSQGFVEPTVVTLHVNNKLPSNIRDQNSIVKLPILNIERIKELMKCQNTEKRVKLKESEDETVDIMNDEFPQSKNKENEIEAITDVEELKETTPQAEDEESETEVIKDVEELKETTPQAENEESETEIEKLKQTAEESEDSDSSSSTEETDKETQESKDSD